MNIIQSIFGPKNLIKLACTGCCGSARLESSSASSNNCWSCQRTLTESETKSFFCPCEHKMIFPINNQMNYFELFGLKSSYSIDKDLLTKNFRKLIRKLHPDLFTQKSEIEKKFSVDQSTRVNKAYRVLSSPISRGLYMLEQAGCNMQTEIVHSHHSDAEKSKILMEILELNELIDEIRSASQVEELERKLENKMKPFERELQTAFESNDFKSAIDIVSKMKYYKNIDERLKELKLKYRIESTEIN